MWYHDPTAPVEPPVVVDGKGAEDLPPTSDQKSNHAATFIDQTTIHGIPYFAGTHQPVCGRVIWLLVFMLSFALCCFTLYPQFMAYLNGDIRTSTVTETRSEIPFPALTFCNINQLRRSIIGQNKSNLPGLLLVLGWMAEEAISQCMVPNPTDSYLQHLNLLPMLNIGPANMLFIGTNSFQHVLSCVHAGLDCSTNIINRITDFGMCFTYNPGQQYRSTTRAFLADPSNTTFPSVLGSPLVATISGPKSALEIVLNAQQYESCDAGGPAEQGAGFLMMIHDPSVDPMYTIQGAHKLPVGFKTEFQLGQKSFDRQTEHLGRCVSNVKLDYFQNATTYDQASCYLECLTKYVQISCNGCMPYYMPREALTQSVAKNHNRSASMCMSGQSLCLTRTEKSFASGQSFQDKCSQCKTPCKESVYTVEQTNFVSFPAANLAPRYMNKKHVDLKIPGPMWSHLVNDSMFQWFQSEYNAHYSQSGNFSSINDIRENILAVKVYFKSLNVEVITELPLTQIPDLAVQLGGASGLFLGASVLSFFEIVYWIILTACQIQKRETHGKTGQTSMQKKYNGFHVENNTNNQKNGAISL